jgi:hypothetical protein
MRIKLILLLFLYDFLGLIILYFFVRSHDFYEDIAFLFLFGTCFLDPSKFLCK